MTPTPPAPGPRPSRSVPCGGHQSTRPEPGAGPATTTAEEASPVPTATTRARTAVGCGARWTRRACLLTATSAALLLCAPRSAAADPAADPQPGERRVLAAASIDQVIANLTNWVVGILAITATLFLTVGGLRYITAAGDPGEVEKAKGSLRNAAIGYCLAVLAPIIKDILAGIVGGPR